jgi:uncharacterized protein YcnI
MRIKLSVLVCGLALSTSVLAGGIITTVSPDNAKAGSVIKVVASKVPSYCDFKDQIVNIGYDKNDDIVMACLKRS